MNSWESWELVRYDMFLLTGVRPCLQTLKFSKFFILTLKYNNTSEDHYIHFQNIWSCENVYHQKYFEKSHLVLKCTVCLLMALYSKVPGHLRAEWWLSFALYDLKRREEKLQDIWNFALEISHLWPNLFSVHADWHGKMIAVNVIRPTIRKKWIWYIWTSLIHSLL